jgi:hypothetical protein
MAHVVQKLSLFLSFRGDDTPVAPERSAESAASLRVIRAHAVRHFEVARRSGSNHRDAPEFPDEPKKEEKCSFSLFAPRLRVNHGPVR